MFCKRGLMEEWRRSVTTNDDKVDFLKTKRFHHILKYLFVKAIWEDNLYGDYVFIMNYIVFCGNYYILQ